MNKQKMDAIEHDFVILRKTAHEMLLGSSRVSGLKTEIGSLIPDPPFKAQCSDAGLSL